MHKLKGIFTKVRNIFNDKGVSLAELVVTFALLSLFMTSAVMLLSSYLEVFARINGMSLAQSVSDTLIETIESNLSNATLNTFKGEDADTFIVISDSNSKVKFSNADGIETEMYLKDNKLQLDYNTYVDKSDEYSEKKTTKWYYSDNFYMNNYIETLKFTTESKKDNLIWVEFKIKNFRTGFEYETKRLIECHNLVNTKTKIKVI